MERIAIISDIHGNIPALQAVLEDIEERQISRIFCIGDLIGKGPNSDLAVDMIRNSCEFVIQGNWDKYITEPSDENPTVTWHRNKLGIDRLEYLRELPFSIEFYVSGRFTRLVHASPRSLFERIQPGDSFDSRLSLFDHSDLCQHQVQADIFGYGDIHNAYIQNFQNKTLFNVGSVGNPLEITQASYAILEGQFDQRESRPYSIQLVRVPYNIELSIEQAIEANMPSLEAYILELRTAEYRGKKSS
ncbi:metallophosphoesterase family protein [Paenibacillus dokdonensis]|uniref:Metallophosphoesterase family protein n=1 Tax=Paenibacillus dokdonensis TaxID=2567944 RepID=A0ABU6GG96_9BACL|nr:metallophosphoesterase family protein [Paenibacillus dokdonensis]MEC0238424.1 metallophosphoesterase family protein [Paenibacillus dokdonensis]